MQTKSAVVYGLAGLSLCVTPLTWAQTAAEVSRVNTGKTAQSYDSLGHDTRPYVAPMLSVTFPNDSNGADIDTTVGGAIALGKPFTPYFSGEVFANFAGEPEINNSIFEKVAVLQYGLTAMIYPAPTRLPVYALASYGLSQFDFDRVGGRGDEPSETGSFWDVGAGARIALTDIGIPDPWGVSLRAEYRYRQADVNVEMGSDSRADDFDIDGHLLQVGFQIPILPPDR